MVRPQPRPGKSSRRRCCSAPWQCLNLRPEPQGQGSLRPDLALAAHERGRGSASGASAAANSGSAAAGRLQRHLRRELRRRGMLQLHAALQPALALGLLALDLLFGADLQALQQHHRIGADAVEHAVNSAKASRLYSCFGFFCA